MLPEMEGSSSWSPSLTLSRKPGKKSIPPASYLPLETATSSVNEHMIHFKQDKTELFKTLTKNSSVASVLQVFTDSNASIETVAPAGKSFLVSLNGYSGKNVPTLDHLSIAVVDEDEEEVELQADFLLVESQDDEHEMPEGEYQ
ncbi:hypothetical protein JTB14_033787 [Gonioctena quinquepunctata]|nr:hypothetical protein JTB14_033787 [Gonioctena quinquepunctata]